MRIGRTGHGSLRPTLVALGVAVVLTACGFAPAGNLSPEFTECNQTTNFAFVGQTSLDAIGLGDAGPDSSRVGMVWVTADPIAMPGGPMPIGVGPEPAASRMVCVEWPDQGGMAMSIDDDWQPPSGGMDISGGASGQELPVGLIGLLVALVVLIGVSVVAFRERPTGG
jgi:hypothetical protein